MILPGPSPRAIEWSGVRQLGGSRLQRDRAVGVWSSCGLCFEQASTKTTCQPSRAFFLNHINIEWARRLSLCVLVYVPQSERIPWCLFHTHNRFTPSGEMSRDMTALAARNLSAGCTHILREGASHPLQGHLTDKKTHPSRILP